VTSAATGRVPSGRARAHPRHLPCAHRPEQTIPPGALLRGKGRILNFCRRCMRLIDSGPCK